MNCKKRYELPDVVIQTISYEDVLSVSVPYGEYGENGRDNIGNLSDLLGGGGS